MMRALIEIHHVSQAGQGVGFDGDKNMYFVAGAIPGDVVEVSYTETEKRYRDAEIIALERPSPDRIEPVCSHFGDCGGCDWLHWEYDAQVRGKERLLFYLLERNGIEFRCRRPITPAPSPLEYRNRIQLHRLGDALGFRRRRSHDIVNIEYCHLAHPKLNQALRELRHREKLPSQDGRFELQLTEKGEVEVHEGEETVSFVQVNSAQNMRLREIVADFVCLAAGNKILELYCGDGNLTFAFRPLEGRIFAIDGNLAAIQKAREHDSGAGASIEFLHSRIDSALPGALPADFSDRYDTLVVDPPRGGLKLSAFIQANVKQILYVSCSPSTFVRDVGSLREMFNFEAIQPLDMFPQTRHVEFVAYLSRR